MSTPIATPELRLRQAVEEKERAARHVVDQERALDAARKRVDEAQAHQAATQVRLKNAEDRHSVLAASIELAEPELAALEARYSERERELAVVREQLQITRVQAETVAGAHAALHGLFASLRGLRADAVVAMEAMRVSVETIRGQSRVTAAVRTMCDVLEATYNDLEDKRTGYEVALSNLETAIGTLQLEIPAAGYERALAIREEQLERDLTETGRELETKRAGIDLEELGRAKKELNAARSAAANAPKALQRANLEFQAASESLVKAQQDQQGAQDQFEQIEAELVTGIELSVPNAGGFVTARAQLSQDDLPAGYTLRWQAGPASVEPETGLEVSIDTSQLPIGQTLVEARLVRATAVA